MFGILLLILFHIAILYVGLEIVNLIIDDNFAILFTLIASIFLGILVSFPVVYFIACIWKSLFAGDPLFFGLILFISIVSFTFIIRQNQFIKQQKKFILKFKKYTQIIFWISNYQTILLSCGAFLFSVWIMFKTFKTGLTTPYLAGSNEVFDFGHALSIIRSFSWGLNLPYSSPFVAGQPDIYHFMFYFWIGLLEHFGIPLVFAVNFPSIFSFFGLIFCVWVLAGYFFENIKIGLLAIILTLTHSTLMFISFIKQHGLKLSLLTDIWKLAKYPFAGPYDSSIISIYSTLDVYVNQRHLAFSLVIFLILYITLNKLLLRQKKEYFTTLIIGFLSGFLVLWHTTIFAACFCCFLWLYISAKEYKHALLYIISFFVTVIIFVFPWLIIFFSGIKSLLTLSAAEIHSVNIRGLTIGSIIQYWWQNVGFLWIFIIGGFWLSKPKVKKQITPVFILFAFSLFLQLKGIRDIDQKFYNLWIVFANIIAAYCFTMIWKIKKLGKIFVIIGFISVTLSGVIDLMVVKNDFAYPVVDKRKLKVIEFFKNESPTDAVALSYPDIFDPVTLSGRRNYWGFYRNIGQINNEQTVRQIYENPDKINLENLSITYVVIPKWQKTDFKYKISLSDWRRNYPVAYEDDFHIIFTSKKL
jgi:hypothetical protein